MRPTFNPYPIYLTLFSSPPLEISMEPLETPTRPPKAPPKPTENAWIAVYSSYVAFLFLPLLSTPSVSQEITIAAIVDYVKDLLSMFLYSVILSLISLYSIDFYLHRCFSLPLISIIFFGGGSYLRRRILRR